MIAFLPSSSFAIGSLPGFGALGGRLHKWGRSCTAVFYMARRRAKQADGGCLVARMDLLHRPGVAVGVAEVDEPSPGLLVDFACLDSAHRPSLGLSLS